ncbi:MAG TPA: P-loop NTPase fold protein [Longimicrobium sp.]|nr:P-loop NTPase fold protein [Longimicrobium sp.]
MTDQSWTLSDSVQRVKDHLRGRKVTAADVLNSLFEFHPEYGEGLAAKVRLKSAKDETPRSVDEIIEAARGVWGNPPTLLHGRFLAVSLALQHPAVGNQLAGSGLLPAIMREFPDMPLVTDAFAREWSALFASVPLQRADGGLSELLKRWRPETMAERVLLAAYVLAHGREGHSVDPREVSAELARSGIAVANITRAMETNVRATPPLMKERKLVRADNRLFALTAEGVAVVEARLRAPVAVQEEGGAPSQKGTSHSPTPSGAISPPVLISQAAVDGGPGTPPPADAEENERVPLHADHPATVDELGRRPFAEIVAQRLEENRATWKRLQQAGGEDADRALMVGIHGPWGAGKSTVLNLLRDQLQADTLPRDDRWVVVEFNAWRNQRVRPPWWTLIQAVYLGSIRQIGFWRALVLRVRWLAWRARADWLPAFAATVLIAAAVVLTTGLFNGISTAPAGDALGKGVELALKIITAVFAAGAAVVAFSRSLLFGSSRAAQAYTEMRSSDPLQPIVRMFSKLVRAVGRPVAVFVDDLDRCDARYVVELLEGMQTLFRTVPMAYVVAADRKWIAASFGKGYQEFGDEIGEPGRPLGYLFLDKLFQLSVPLPLLSPERKRAYWTGLLRASGSADPRLLEVERKAAEGMAEAIIGDAHTHEALSLAIAAHDDDALLQEGLRAVAARRITSAQAQRETEHRLRHFDELLEPNPRSMKRLVNAYGLHQAAQYIETGGVRPETLARWTIVELRWPLLAEYLVLHPAAIAQLRGQTAPEGISAPLRALFADDGVHAVVAPAGDDDPGLDEDAIRRIAGRPAAAPKVLLGPDIEIIPLPGESQGLATEVRSPASDVPASAAPA